VSLKESGKFGLLHRNGCGQDALVSLAVAKWCGRFARIAIISYIDTSLQRVLLKHVQK
jgi:hypothetical protein